TDSFEEIGLPKGARVTDFEESNLDKRIKLWAKATAELYPPVTPPPEGGKETVDDDKEEADEKYPEPSIDALRKQKREELRRYKEKKTDKKPSAKKDAKE
ncbi:hypothetical protein DYB30_007746, partial [Aphanomyces astaci]